MPIKVTTAAEPIKVEQICMTIYSQPGLGKTSLSFTASKPLLLDFDKGAYRAVDRKDVVQVEKWADVANITAADLEPYDTVIVDTVGKALEFLTADIINGNSRLAFGGALNQQGWGQLGVRFGAFLRHLRRLGKDVVLLSHMDEKADGDTIKERLKISGGSKDQVLTDSDVIARISIHNRERQLVFSPTETSFGKDPTQIGMMPLPDAASKAFATCLADIIAGIKDSLNKLSAEQVERRGEVEWFKASVPQMNDAAAINGVLGRAKRAGRDIAKMVADRATEIGLEFDPHKHEYVYLEEMDMTGADDRAETDEAAA